MRKLAALLFLSFALLFAPFELTGCKNSPDSRTQTVTTLKIVGTSAKASIDAAASLLRDGKITVSQWQNISSFYDQKWQPAFSLAVSAAHSDLSTLASPDLVQLFAQLSVMVSDLTKAHGT